MVDDHGALAAVEYHDRIQVEFGDAVSQGSGQVAVAMTTWTRASTSAGGRPRAPSSRGKPFREQIIS